MLRVTKVEPVPLGQLVHKVLKVLRVILAHKVLKVM